jgi:hypothetical protein
VHRSAASCCQHVRLNDAKMPSSCGKMCSAAQHAGALHYPHTHLDQVHRHPSSCDQMHMKALSFCPAFDSKGCPRHMLVMRSVRLTSEVCA